MPRDPFKTLSLLKAHFYTPLGLVRIVRFCTAPKPPLCKGRCSAQRIKIAMIAGGNHTTIYRWHGEAVTEGLCDSASRFLSSFGEIALQ